MGRQTPGSLSGSITNTTSTEEVKQTLPGRTNQQMFSVASSLTSSRGGFPPSPGLSPGPGVLSQGLALLPRLCARPAAPSPPPRRSQPAPRRAAPRPAPPASQPRGRLDPDPEKGAARHPALPRSPEGALTETPGPFLRSLLGENPRGVGGVEGGGVGVGMLLAEEFAEGPLHSLVLFHAAAGRADAGPGPSAPALPCPALPGNELCTDSTGPCRPRSSPPAALALAGRCCGRRRRSSPGTESYLHR